MTFNERLLRQAIELAGLGRVVFALSGDQLASLKRGGFAPVPQESPALFEEARNVVDGYYL